MSVQIILPDTTITHYEDLGFERINQLRRELNLKDLSLGVDSFELRIYQEFTLGSPDKLYIIKNENHIWKCSVYEFWTGSTVEETTPMSYRDMISHTIIDSCEFINVIPKCGWDKFIDSLNLFSTFSIPSQTEIPSFKDVVSDGIDFKFEIATSEKYKYFSYHCPDYYKDKNNKMATEFLELISRQISPVWFCNLP